MRCKFLHAMLIFLSVLSVPFSCSNDSKPGKETEPSEITAGGPIKVVAGKVRFFVDVSDDAPRVLAGVKKSWILDNIDALYINGKSYGVTADEKGNLYADVLENSNGTYNAALALKSDNKWFSSNPGDELNIPCGQFYGVAREKAAMTQFPMFGKYSEATGNRILMTDMTGMLRLRIKGDGRVVSVKLQTADGKPAGVFLRDGDKLVSSDKSSDFIALNCTEDGNYVEMGNDFDMFLAPGNYNNAELVICDSRHKVMRTALDFSIEAGQMVTKEIAYSADKDVLWYDGFDLCVWGGNIMGGSEAGGFSPTSGTVTASSGTDLTGKEYALASVSYNTPGTGYVQPDNWSAITGKSVGVAHQMSESYVNSRNFADYNLLFRVQEFPGMMAVSYASNVTRGILKTPQFKNIEGIRNIKVSMRFCPLAGFADDFLAQIVDGGMITGATLNGKELSLKSLGYKANGSQAVFAANSVQVPADMVSPNEWQTLELSVENATESTCLHVCGNTTNAVSHSFLVDAIEVTDMGKTLTRGTLRVLYWNIQNGMWSDQANNYDNFVEWVKRYDPDVCVWCESASIYKDNTNVSADASERFLPDGWPSVAKRYGHNYSALGGWRDNYPQEITSKYPITTLLKITDTDVSGKPVSHGAAIQQLDINGKKLNVVTLHTWPQSYGYGVSAADRDASSAKNEGDYYREYEMKYILEHTVNSPDYASQTDWLMMGDFNSKNYSDEWAYQLGEASTAYLCQNAIKNNSNMVDIIGNKYPGYLVSTTSGNSRIDYMYASPSMYAKIKNAITVIDTYTVPVADTKYGTVFYIPSDHRPILVDFEY